MAWSNPQLHANAAEIGSRPFQRNAKSIPVTVLTGFLGSGKTTLLNDMLKDRRMAGTAVIVNEFGSVPVDHDLVRAGKEQYVLTTTGCICCTARSDLRTSLFDLQESVRLGIIPGFARVIVETTGLADPAPIVNALIPGGAPAFGLRDHAVAKNFHLAGVMATLDVTEADDALANHKESLKQLAFADHVVLTKTDLGTFDLAEWTKRLRRVNPLAGVSLRGTSGFDATKLIGNGFYVPSRQADGVAEWLAMESAGADHDHSRAPNRHGDRINAVPLLHDGALDGEKFQQFLEELTGQDGKHLLRLKGLVALGDNIGQPHVIHAVQHKLYPSILLENGWPSADRRSRLMVIVRDVPAEEIMKQWQMVVG